MRFSLSNNAITMLGVSGQCMTSDLLTELGTGRDHWNTNVQVKSVTLHEDLDVQGSALCES